MKKNGFSLMEMMVVLLIVAIVAAASAPMVSKKLASHQNMGSSPWDWINNAQDTVFNFQSQDKTVIIGDRPTFTGATERPALYIASKKGKPQISFKDRGTGSPFYLQILNDGIIFSKRKVDESDFKKASVVIGSDASADGERSVAIGDTAKAGSDSAVAIGLAKADGKNSVAIGNDANAEGNNSVAIGYGTYAEGNNTIALGSSGHIVKIPGRLEVEHESTFNNDAKFTYPVGFNDNVKFNYSVDFIQDESNITINGLTLAECIQKYVQTPSDRRLKEVGKASTEGLDKIRKLEVFNYVYKKDPLKTPHVGVIAQDLQKIFPDAVSKGPDGFLRIRMEDMFYAVVNAVKELDKKVESVVADIVTLKTKIDSYEKTIAELQNQSKVQQAKINDLEKRLTELEKR